MKKIVALLGDYYHHKDAIQEGLETALSPIETELDVQIIVTEELISRLKEQPDLFILNKENRLNPEDGVINTWMNEEIENAIVDYVKTGGSILAWHAGMALYPTDGNYIQMLKGYFKYHSPGMQAITYHNKDTSFTIEDEHYMVHCEKEQTNVFLTSTSTEGESIAGWQHNFENGKVCCLTPAHTKEGILDTHVQKMLLKKILWCLSPVGFCRNTTLE